MVWHWRRLKRVQAVEVQSRELHEQEARCLNRLLSNVVMLEMYLVVGIVDDGHHDR